MMRAEVIGQVNTKGIQSPLSEVRLETFVVKDTYPSYVCGMRGALRPFAHSRGQLAQNSVQAAYLSDMQPVPQGGVVHYRLGFAISGRPKHREVGLLAESFSLSGMVSLHLFQTIFQMGSVGMFKVQVTRAWSETAEG